MRASDGTADGPTVFFILMRKTIERINKGDWPDSDQAGTVTLPFDDRHRRRIRLMDDAGEPFLLDLAEAEHLHDGDGLRLDNGGIILVQSALEDVLDIECQDPAHTARIAWHIGNRHIPLQVLSNSHLRIRADHVLAEMLRGLGTKVVKLERPFSPEPGAYAESGGGHHEH
jgi:urease accessory protein